MEDVLEEYEEKPVIVPQVVKVMAWLVYFGNIILALLLIIVLLWAIANPESFETAVKRVAPAPNEALIAILVVLVICVLPIVGAALMSKGKKSGFWIYSIVNLLWIVINFRSMNPPNIVMACISVGFVITFATQLKHLR